MSCVTKLNQCRAVIRCVSNGRFLSLQNIYDYLEKVGVDPITNRKGFQRLLEYIDSEFDIRIEYSTQSRGYYIVESEDDDGSQNLVELYDMADSIGFTAANLNDLKKMKDFIQTTNSKDFENREYISQLLSACLGSREVTFNYRKYGSELQEATKRKVQPYQIREFQGRWYLIGIEPDLIEVEPHPEITKFRAYGFDRMFNLLKGNPFIRRKDKEFQKHYADVIGIENGYRYQEGTNIAAEKIRFRTDTFTWNFIHTLPWHHSQKQVGKSDESVEFELFVKPTSELVRLILQWSPQVEVLMPESLRDAVLAELKKSVALYAD